MATPDALQLFGVTLVGATPENGRKLLLTLALIVIACFFRVSPGDYWSQAGTICEATASASGCARRSGFLLGLS